MLLRNGEHRPFLELPIMCLVYVDFNTTLILQVSFAEFLSPNVIGIKKILSLY